MEQDVQYITTMKRKIAMLLAALTFTVCAVSAQDAPRKVENLPLIDMEKNPTLLPFFGEKNLMIFYVDPDARTQNEEFTEELEETHRADSPEIFGFGIINAKDTAIPNSLIRLFARKRTAKNKALVLLDDDRRLSTQWKLGDCNDKFVLLFVNKAGELVFMRKGELSKKDQQEFLKVIDQHK